MTGNINGRDIVYEDLRQICISRKNLTDWWSYALLFSDLCLSTGTNIKQCSYKTLGILGISTIEIEKCVNASFLDGENQTFSENLLLKVERDHFIQKGIQAWPTIVINNVTFRVYFVYIFIILITKTSIGINDPK